MSTERKNPFKRDQALNDASQGQIESEEAAIREASSLDKNRKKYSEQG
jgi:hypothetical protein